MSDKAADTGSNVTALPQFMKENDATVELEEKESWLNNNLHKLMIGVSVVWFAVVLIYITQFFGWSNLFLMMPDEFGGFLAGVTLPLAIIWVVMAYIDRGTSFKKEAKFLRAYMNQLVYPEDGAPQTAKAMADAIRSQVVELQQVSKLAHEQTSKIKDSIRGNIDEFAKLVGTLDNYSSKTIVELSEGVKFLMANFENVLGKAKDSSENFAKINQEFVDGGRSIETSIKALFDKLEPSLQEMKKTAEDLRQTVSGTAEGAVQANESLKNFVEQTNATFNAMHGVLTGQTNLLKQVGENAVDSCDAFKENVAKEIAGLDDVMQKHSQQLYQAMEAAGREAKDKTDEVTKSAISNIGIINNNLKKSMDNIDDTVDLQIHKIEEALAKRNRDIMSFVKLLEDKTDDVSKKFTAHGEVVAQELDRLMVRSSNLEDAVALQISNLNGVADKAITSMQEVESALAGNVASLDEKVLSANGDILSYIDTLQEKTSDFERISNDSIDKITDLTDVINKRYDELQKKTSVGINQLQEADKEINDATENLLVQVSQSAENLGQISSLMQKHTAGLAEASSIVVTQSQISEASLAQQQKHITDTAARVEEIKNELKRQIDELSTASGSLERDAVNTLELLKSNIAKMLGQCNDAVNKSRALNSDLLENANQFDTSANKTMAKVTQFEDVLVKQTQNMETLVQNVSDMSDKVSKILDAHTQKLNETTVNTENVLNRSIDEFEAKSVHINDVSQSAAHYIGTAAAGLDEKTAALNILFRQQEADFYAYCDKVSENTNKMAEILKKQIANVEEGADKLFARLVILEEDTGRRAETVMANSQKSIQELAEIEKMLADKHQQTEKTVDAAIGKLRGVNDAVNEHIAGFAASVVSMKENVDDTLRQISGDSAKLKDLYQSLSKDSNQLWQQLSEQSKYMESAGLKIASQGESIAGMLETQKNNITEVVNNLATQARLGEASLAQQYKYLTDATVETAAKMQEINNGFKDNTGGIFDMTNKLSYEFEVLGDRLLKACDAINKASKDSVKNIDQVSLRLNQCSEDLDTAIYHSVENIGGVFNEYEKYLAGFNTVTAETSTGVVEINNLISAQSDKMVKISEDTKKLVNCFNTVLNDTSNQLADRANDAYDKVQSLGQDLKKLGLEMEDAAKLSATHLEKSGDKLRASINEIAANAERISNTILSSGEVFVKQSQALTVLADDTTAKVGKSIENLVEAGIAFETQGQELVKESLRFNDTVNVQTKTLSENAARAEKAMKGLTTAYKDIKVDTFLKDAGKIISRLESVSVDINRLLNPKDEEDLWKKFYNGDTEVFIRSIAKNMSNTQISALRKEFEKNDDLRKLVNTYMSEFEALVEKSKKNEHSAALMAVISGADLGRLYYVLAKALNKLN